MPDTSCMVPALSTWDPNHERAHRAIGTRRERGERMVVAAAALVETYSSLTRMPPPYRRPPQDVLRAIEHDYVGDVVALESDEYLALLRDAAQRGIAGGTIYDAVIAACARKAGVDVLLTFNERHFLPLAGSDFRVVVPP